MKVFNLIIIFCLAFQIGTSQKRPKPEETEVWDPEPRVVSPGYNFGPPSDAIVLFDGIDLSKWESERGGGSAKWKINPDGSMTIKPGTGNIITKEEHGSIQFHIEWKSPVKIVGEGQGRGNSGIMFQRRYEVQVLDSYNNRTYSNGQASSIYKQYVPLVNAMRPTGEWQVYDIVFIEPKFDASGEMTEPGSFTVFHNGIVVHNNVEIMGTTEYIGSPKRGRDEMPGYGNTSGTGRNLLLQDHSNYVSYRNIWMRKL